MVETEMFEHTSSSRSRLRVPSQRVGHSATRSRGLSVTLMLMTAMLLGGCNFDSFLDPTTTGYWEPQPTEIPVLERLAVIEDEPQRWTDAEEVQPEDLVPSDLTYRVSPGDVITVEIYELLAQGVYNVSTRRVDAGGRFRLPQLGDVMAAGKTPQELQEDIVRQLEQEVMPNPQVNVVVEEGAGFKYTVYGAVRAPGVYTLRDPDLRLLDALAIVGGVPDNTDEIYVIRHVPLTQRVKPTYEDTRPPGEGALPEDQAEPDVDVEQLIDELEREDQSGGGGAGGGNNAPLRDVSPGSLAERFQDQQPEQQQSTEPPVDIDDLEPVRQAEQPEVDVDELAQPDRATRTRPRDRGGDTWIYIPEYDRWVRSSDAEDGGQPAAQPDGAPSATRPTRDQLMIERIIKIPYEPLRNGEASYNLVVRPDDRIYVPGPVRGFVYIGGEVARPGVYNLPNYGKQTLSRLISTAGGLGPLAIPERVDLTRVIGDSREATVTLDLAAIRNRTEPDVYLQPDDHIIVGTNFWAAPLAVIRNGFRMTYGFGFLLDRNFGNDVFGAPPVNRIGQ